MHDWLAALPVYNEQNFVATVLDEVARYANRILVVNDGSTDETAERLLDWQRSRPDCRLEVIHHAENRGYGAALKSAFEYSIDQGYKYLVTLDCDGQHQPKRIPRFLSACAGADCGGVDIVSGSRYLKQYEGDSQPPSERLYINKRITSELNEQLNLRLTDAFCGFKAYRVEALKLLDIQDDGYAMPLELWVQAAMRGMRIIEIPVPLIYLDLNRSFGGALDQAEKRLHYYHEVIARSVKAMQDVGFSLPSYQSSVQGCHR